MITNPLGYQVIDGDSHYYEADDCFSRHIDPVFADRAVHLVPTERPGIRKWVAAGGRTLPGSSHNFGDSMPAPGAYEEIFAGRAALGLPDLIRPREFPEMMQRPERYRFMDDNGVKAHLLLPTLALEVEPIFGNDTPALCANFRSFNRWLEEDWTFGSDGRNFTVPLMTLRDIEWAVEETYRLAGLGCRMVYLYAGPVGNRSPADPYFDPFWRTIEETGMRVVFHDTAFSEYLRMYASHWSEDPERNLWEWSPLQFYYSEIERPITDTIAALLLHNLFGRFPGVQIVSVELGSSWVRNVIRLCDRAVKFGRNGFQLGGKLDALPSETLPQHLTVSPYFEDDIRDLVDLIGIDRVMFGSDWPHPEGVTFPLKFLEYISDFTEVEKRQLMHDTAASLVGLPALPTLVPTS